MWTVIGAKFLVVVCISQLLSHYAKHSKFIGLKQQPLILTLVSVIQLGVCCCTLAKLVSYASSFHCVSTYFLIASQIKSALCMLSGARLKRQHLLSRSSSHGDNKSVRRQGYGSPFQAFLYISANIPLTQASHMVEHKVMWRVDSTFSERDSNVTWQKPGSCEQLGPRIQSTISPLRS